MGQPIYYHGLARRDGYEKHVKLYWVEKRLSGRQLRLDCKHKTANQFVLLCLQDSTCSVCDYTSSCSFSPKEESEVCSTRRG